MAMNREHVRSFDSELIIGLVAAAGTQVKLFADRLVEQLHLARYTTCVIKVSRDVIPELVNTPPSDMGAFRRISDLMDAGNTAREKSKQEDIMALGAAAKVRAKRKQENGETQPLLKTAIIIDSLKRPEEVESLRNTYSSGFILVGVHEEVTRRKKHLVDQGMSEDEASCLIDRDSNESTVEYGQRVSETFHLADFFVQVQESHDRLEADTRRMVELWFGNPFITPTFDEHAMFMAFSAGLTSADLSRQVGAVVTRERQILSTGANDCPMAGGGLYWPERRNGNPDVSDAPRGRDYKRGHDSNRVEQNRIIDEILKMCDSRQIEPGGLRSVLEDSRIGDLTEFGRVVHAEMDAMLACAREGISTRAATLYCTTFPCHNCAKHIVAAGFKRVVFIEPYPKSKALEFHDDAVLHGDSSSSDDTPNKVVFEPFVGVGPRRFFDLFSLKLTSGYPKTRKDSKTGKALSWDIKNARLRIQMQPMSYLDLELHAISLYSPASTEAVSLEESNG